MTAAASLRPFARVWFCYFAAMGAFQLYGPLWFRELGLSALAIGSIASLQSWTRVFAPYSWAWIADHSNERARLMRVAGVLCVASSLALALAGRFGIAAVSLCVAVLFIANGAVIPLMEASLAQHLNLAAGGGAGGRYGRARVWGSIGFMASVLLAGALLNALGIRIWPWLVLLLWALLAVSLWHLPLANDPASHEKAPAGALAVLRRPEVAWFFAGVFLTVLAHVSLYTFFSLFAASFGMGETAIGVLWSVGVLVEIGFFWTQGHWFGRLSMHNWLLLAAGVSVLRFGLMAAFGHWTLVLVLTQATHAVTFAAQHAACITLVARYFPGRLRGRGQALYSTLGYGLSGVIGGVAGGALIERWGYPAVFWASALSALLAAGCLLRSRRHALATAASATPVLSA
ncbi:MAG: MFS transporter [Ideonella sp.]|nr:MFS transporter [Ideonella sp.]MCC7459326.1 MFS transporter [Nitrospira sp.]